ncbi:MAG: YpdA family putative bacillithiol disulfide reductase [Lewinellaceae bacterium]|nr:YpdA family putative bacillithiol disulfide reductase [Saprospiraceae bacterium]MCB9337511.1 YpdA family putative bacillithiol disulfide reductase [Lewinellaceae bacterium]
MKNENRKILDLLIIGAGPSGLACAIDAEKKKLDYLIVEKGVLVNSIFRFPANMTFFSTSLKLEIGEVPFISHVDKPTRKEALEYYRRIYESWKLKVKLYEEVLGMERQPDGFYEITTSKNKYQARAVVVATGFYDKPRLMGVPGEDLPKVKHFYDEAHPYVGQKVLVVGAANSACDVALETFYKGSEVTMAIREGGIYEKVKYWIRPNIENRIEEGSIKAFFNTTVKAIRPHEVVLDTPEGEVVVENDFVLAMTGYQPDFEFLEKIGIRFNDDESRTPIMNEETFESNLPNVYLAGVVQAGLNTSKLFIENTRHHGEQIIGQITGE